MLTVPSNCMFRCRQRTRHFPCHPATNRTSRAGHRRDAGTSRPVWRGPARRPPWRRRLHRPRQPTHRTPPNMTAKVTGDRTGDIIRVLVCRRPGARARRLPHDLGLPARHRGGRRGRRRIRSTGPEPKPPPRRRTHGCRMPGMDGLQATRQLLATGQGPRVLMLTTFDLDEYVYDALRAGASGFLLKDVRPSSWQKQSVWWRRGRPCSPPRSPGGWSSSTSGDRDPAPRDLGHSSRSPNANSRCSPRWRADTPTPRSLPSCSSARPPSSPTSPLFSKLRLHDRAQAVVVAYESGLVEPGETTAR